MKKTFPANVAYTLTDWKEGVDLSKEDEDLVRKEIEKKYIDFTATFKNQDLSKYKKLTELRQENAFISMYYDYKQKKLAERSYVGGIENSKVKLFPLENYRLVFYGDGKLAGLQKLKEAPGIFIDNQNEEDAFMEYILFYKKNKNSPLEIIL